MFDVYMTAQAVDPRARRRFVMASMLAVAASMLALGSYVGGQRLSIRKVDAPRVDLDVLLASVVASPPMVASPPPSPEPPKPPDVEPEPNPSVAPRPEVDDDADEDVLEPVSGRDTGRNDSGGPQNGGSGVPGPLTGGSGIPCPIPGGCRTNVVATRPVNTDTTRTTAHVPLSVVQARLRFSPDPSRAELLRTPAGQRGQGGTSVVSFCIGEDGHVEDVKTKRSAGDGEVDRICRAALSRWRFLPLEVRGKATRTCSEASFTIAFE